MSEIKIKSRTFTAETKICPDDKVLHIEPEAGGWT